MFEAYDLPQQLGRSRGSRKGTRDAGAAEPSPVSPDIARRGDYVTSAEALQRLGVKQQTLYAYVSRGLIRSLPHVNGRSRYYLREDVERARERGSMRYGPGFVALGAMRGSQAVIDTAITEITVRGPSYRGRPAIELARAGIPFENVAEFLWGGNLAESRVVWTEPCLSDISNPLTMLCQLSEGQAHIVQLMCMAVLRLGIAAGTRRERLLAGRGPLDMARQILRTQASVMGCLGPNRRCDPIARDSSIATTVLKTLGLPQSAEHQRVVDGLLVVVADHELHPATFAARIAASASNDMHSCVCAALSTQCGTVLGRSCDRVETLFDPSATPDEILAAANAELKAARGLPGFDHPFYPNGDPRAHFLMEQAMRISKSDNAVVRKMHRLVGLIEEDFGIRPSIEFGLVMLCRSLGLPAGSASGLYALGFTSGWVAHILEQRKAGFIIRPRAKYTTTATASSPEESAPSARIPPTLGG